jgi:hypothetical protein
VRTIRIHTLAKELGVSSKDILRFCKHLGFDVKHPLSPVKLGLADAVRSSFSKPSGGAMRPADLVLSLAETDAGEGRVRSQFVEIEVGLVNLVVLVLQNTARQAGCDWWYGLVPLPIRRECAVRQEEDGGVIHKKHAYWDFLHLKKIIEKNWQHFGPIFRDAGEASNKGKALSWMDRMNELRKFLAHPARAHVAGKTLSEDDVAFIAQRRSFVRDLYSAALAPSPMAAGLERLKGLRRPEGAET